MLRSLGFGKISGIDSISLSLLEAFTAEISLSKPAHSTTSLSVVGKRKRKPLRKDFKICVLVLEHLFL